MTVKKTSGKAKAPAKPRKKRVFVPDPESPDSVEEQRQRAFSPDLWMRNRYIVSRNENIIYGQGRFWRYGNDAGKPSHGIWTEVPLWQIRSEIAEIGNSPRNTWFRVSSSSVASVVDLIRDKQAVVDERFDSNPDVILFNDCVVDLNTFQRTEHDRKYCATSKLPFNCDPSATCPAWAKWGERIDKDVLLYLEEWGGLALTTDQRFEKSIWLVGKPNCGKGTFIEALCTVLGEKRWTTISSEIIGNRFGLVNLAGKTLAFASETAPIKTAGCIDIVNRMISGEPIRVEQKGQPGYDLRPRTKVLCAMNRKPAVNNPDSGLFRRTDIVEMPPLNVAIDPKIKEEIIASGPAMANVFLAGLRRLRERGYFEVPKSVQIASAEFRTENDHVALFFEDEYKPAPGVKQKASNVYEVYKQWCSDNGFRDPLNSKELIPELGRFEVAHKRSDGSWYIGLERK